MFIFNYIGALTSFPETLDVNERTRFSPSMNAELLSAVACLRPSATFEPQNYESRELNGRLAVFSVSVTELLLRAARARPAPKES